MYKCKCCKNSIDQQFTHIITAKIKRKNITYTDALYICSSCYDSLEWQQDDEENATFFDPAFIVIDNIKYYNKKNK